MVGVRLPPPPLSGGRRTFLFFLLSWGASPRGAYPLRVVPTAGGRGGPPQIFPISTESFPEFEKSLRAYLKPFQEMTEEERAGWVCGLGHGVLPKTPEENVKNFIKLRNSKNYLRAK